MYFLQHEPHAKDPGKNGEWRHIELFTITSSQYCLMVLKMNLVQARILGYGRNKYNKKIPDWRPLQGSQKSQNYLIGWPKKISDKSLINVEYQESIAKRQNLFNFFNHHLQYRYCWRGAKKGINLNGLARRTGKFHKRHKISFWNWFCQQTISTWKPKYY